VLIKEGQYRKGEHNPHKVLTSDEKAKKELWSVRR
jgi:hypothetical protein